MHIGLAGPVSLDVLASSMSGTPNFPPHYQFPFTAHLALAYHKLGHTVSVFTTSSEVPDKGLTHHGPRFSIHLVRSEPRGWLNTLTAFRTARRNLIAALQSAKPDVLHAHWPYEFAVAALDSGIPALVTAHDAPWTVVRHSIAPRTIAYRTVRALMAHNTSIRAVRMTAVSPYLAGYWRKTMRRRLPLAVVPNGVDAIPCATAKHLPTDGTPCCIAINQGFGRLKNTSTLIRAWPRILARIPGARLILLGAGHGPGEAAQQWAKHHLLGKGINFRGAVSNGEVYRMLAEEAHLLIHPSREESFGMALLEAHSVGLPSVGGRDSGGVPYVMAGGATGRLVDVTDPLSIAHGACELLCDPQAYEKCSAAALAISRERFSLDSVAHQYLDELAQL